MLLAQLTDTHIKADAKLAYGVVDTHRFLEHAVQTVNRLDPCPDLVVMTGDLVDFGDQSEYGVLRELLEPLRMPYRLAVGNHDNRANLKAVFADHARLAGAQDYLRYTIEDWPLRLIVLDTVVPGQGGGLLCAERLAWLDARLAEQPHRPTIIAMHHPPFRSGIAHMDAIGLANAAGFAAVIARYGNIERIICGHLHRDISVRFAGTVASTSPSVAHQVALDLREDALSRFMMEPPAFQLHHWTADAGLRSHTAFIGDFAGPYPFFNIDGTLIDT